MNARWLVFVLAFGAAVATAQEPPGVQRARLRLTIPSFRDAGPIPLQFTCYADGGKAMSPLLRWEHVPEATRSFVVMVTGPENQRRRGHTVAFFWVAGTSRPARRSSRKGSRAARNYRTAVATWRATTGSWGMTLRAHRRAPDRFITSSSCTRSIRCCLFPRMPLATPSCKRWMATSLAPACTTECWSACRSSDVSKKN